MTETAMTTMLKVIVLITFQPVNNNMDYIVSVVVDDVFFSLVSSVSTKEILYEYWAYSFWPAGTDMLLSMSQSLNSHRPSLLIERQYVSTVVGGQ